jgi:hypothetical protein
MSRRRIGGLDFISTGLSLPTGRALSTLKNLAARCGLCPQIPDAAGQAVDPGDHEHVAAGQNAWLWEGVRAAGQLLSADDIVRTPDCAWVHSPVQPFRHGRIATTVAP